MEMIRNLIHSDLSLIKNFRDEMTRMFEDLDYDDEMVFKIRLILDELIINSYKHGNNMEYDKLIDIIVLIGEDYCMIKVKDEGDGINYIRERDLLSDHGRGIQLVYSLADNLLVRDNTIAAFLNINH